MQESNIIERAHNKGVHTRISSIAQKPAQQQVKHHLLQQDERQIEISILKESLDSLFTSSLLFDEQSILEIITALAQLTMSNTQGDDFGLRRLCETTLVNISRLQIFWNSLVAHFQLLLQAKEPR